MRPDGMLAKRYRSHGARRVRDAQGRVHHGMPCTGWMPRAARVRASPQATTARRGGAARPAEVDTPRARPSGRGEGRGWGWGRTRGGGEHLALRLLWKREQRHGRSVTGPQEIGQQSNGQTRADESDMSHEVGGLIT